VRNNGPRVFVFLVLFVPLWETKVGDKAGFSSLNSSQKQKTRYVNSRPGSSFCSELTMRIKLLVSLPPKLIQNNDAGIYA